MTPFVKETKGTKPVAERKSKEGSYMEQGEEQIGDDVDLETGIPRSGQRVRPAGPIAGRRGGEAEGQTALRPASREGDVTLPCRHLPRKDLSP